MLDKVYVVENGAWDCDPYEGYNDWGVVAVCDTFESACNYIRSRLTEKFNEFKTWRTENPDYCSDLSLEEAFRHARYTYDPNNLPVDAMIGMNMEFITYGDDDEGWGFIIREHEIKHYD